MLFTFYYYRNFWRPRIYDFSLNPYWLALLGIWRCKSTPLLQQQCAFVQAFQPIASITLLLACQVLLRLSDWPLHRHSTDISGLFRIRRKTLMFSSITHGFSVLQFFFAAKAAGHSGIHNLMHMVFCLAGISCNQTLNKKVAFLHGKKQPRLTKAHQSSPNNVEWVMVKKPRKMGKKCQTTIFQTSFLQDIHPKKLNK